MYKSRLTLWILAFLFSLSGVLTAFPAIAASSTAAKAAAPEPKLDNATCLTCHDSKKGKIEMPGIGGDKHTVKGVNNDKYGKSVHAKMQCVTCHTDIVDSNAPQIGRAHV